MASLLHFSGYYRGILRNVLPLLQNLKSGQGARIAPRRCPHATPAAFSPRCFATETVQRNVARDMELGFGQGKKLDRALYRLDMDVRRTGRIMLKDVKDIFTEIKALGNPSSTQCLLLIRCCGALLPEELPETRTKLVDDIWNTLEQQNVALDVSHYNAVLKVYLENEHQFVPTDFLAKMQAKGVEPNRVTYQRLIAHYCQKGDISGASKILEFMKEKDLPINENVFNALIQGHARANDMENAKAVLEVMRNAKLEPGPSTYTQLLCGYAEKGDFESIKATLSEMKKHDVFLLDRDYLEVIFVMATNGAAQHIDELIPMMHKSIGYNQDAVNFVLQLVNHGQDDVAYRLLMTMPRSTQVSGDPTPVGRFFLRHLVKMKRPKEKILQICNELKQRDLNPDGILRATESALVFENTEYAAYFLAAMMEQGLPIRPHYFWPIIASHAKSNNEEGIYNTIRLMKEMGTQANFDTLLEYVYPGLNLQDPSTVVQKFKDLGYTVGSVVGPMVTYFVQQKDLNSAVQLCKMYPVRLTPGSLMQNLATAYRDSRDLESVADILMKVLTNQEPNKKTDWTGQFLVDYVRSCEPSFEDLATLLQGLKSKNLGISRSMSDSVQRRFKQNLPKNVVDLLEELTSSELRVDSEHLEASGFIPHPREMNVNDLENHLTELKAKDLNTRGVLRRLLMEHARLRNLDRVLQIKAELDEQSFVYSPAMLAQLLHLHISHDDLTEALRYKEMIHEMDPGFALDDYKILNLAALMVRQDRLEDAVKLISEHHQKHDVRQRVGALENNCWRLLNSAADKGNVDGVKRLLNLLLECGFCAPENSLLGPMVKVHLLNDDLTGALAEFENCCSTYRCTPWKNELFTRLIKLEDAERLQKVVDLSTDIHGEMNTMYDLAFAFIDGDQLKQAKKIFETPGFRARVNRLDTICEKYLEDGKVKQLEQLVMVTRDIFNIDRDRMYYQLIRAYAKEGDAAKALGVWTTMQEENVQPSDSTLTFLGNFLRKSGQDVPFAIPAESREQQQENKQVSQSYDRLEASLANASADEAMDIKRRLEAEGQQLTSIQSSALMGTLLAASRVNDALNVAKELFQRGELPYLNKLKILVRRLADAGDVDNVTYVGNNVADSVQRRIGYHNLKSAAYIRAGLHQELLDSLEAGFPDNQLEFPKSGVVDLLNEHPECLGRVEALAARYAEVNYHAPLNMMWQYHFIKGDDTKAEAIYKSTPYLQEKLMFMDVVKSARQNHNEALLRKLSDVVRAGRSTSRTRGILYSAIIDVTLAKGNVDEALRTYNEAITDGVGNTDFNRQSLLGLKRSLTEAGKTVPFNVDSLTDRQTSSSSSSSDSDSEDEKPHRN